MQVSRVCRILPRSALSWARIVLKFHPIELEVRLVSGCSDRPLRVESGHPDWRIDYLVANQAILGLAWRLKGAIAGIVRYLYAERASVN